MKKYFRKYEDNTNTRLIIIFTGIIIFFLILVIRLYILQIIQGEFLLNQVTGTTVKEISVSASRGNIYDRLGRPLAVNNSSFTVNFDQSVTIENINEIILSLINLLENNKEEIVDDFPISKEKPYYFLLDDNEKREKSWKIDMGLKEDLTASEAFLALREKFEISDELSDEDARKILIVRAELYKKRYSRFMPVTIAYDISQDTIGLIEENKDFFNGVYIDVEALRSYPTGVLFSHIIGYIRGITQSELETYQKYGYTQSDIVGKEGIEKAFELQLKGTDGTYYYEVDNLGRKVKEYTENSKAPTPGNDIFLTVDAELQKTAYTALEEALRDAIISRLTGQSKDYNYTPKEVLISMIKANTISIKKIMDSEEGTFQNKIKNYILTQTKTEDPETEELKSIFTKAVENGEIYQSEVLLTIIEQGIVSADETYINKIKSGAISSLQFLLDNLNSGQITPQMTNMDPSTGSVIITDVNTGGVLATVSYPSYDNNKFVNNFDSQYYTSLQNDPTTPLVNRPFTEPRAPGSTFKMITAVAGLEESTITKNTTIYDKGIFKDAGNPYARCWIYSNNKGSHGNINVAQALEVSCNYFFYDLAYRLGNSGKTNIEILNKYMKSFGLNDRTGTEIYELYDSTTTYPSNISSPEYKEYITKLRYPNTSESDLKWTEGETIRTAIGQSYNNYTIANLAKYIATLANGGTRYSLHFLDKVKSSDGNLIEEYGTNIEETLNLKESTIETVHEGMALVTSGSKGTLRSAFKNFPIKVAAKSGTAQQSSYRSDHTVFVGFVPYDEPMISIAISIPYGNDITQPAPKVAKKVIEKYLGLNNEPEKYSYNLLTE